MMNDLSVMILCGQSPRHLYVANRLCQSARPVAIVHESSGDRSLGKLIGKLRPTNLWRKGWRWLRDRRRYMGNKEAQFFFGDQLPRLERDDLRVEVPHINHSDVVAIADKLQPDVIAVFGTSLIRGPLLERSRLGIINLHGGLSPHYRGADCTFWALYNEEYEQIGCTLHFIDPGIDTGALIAHICPEVREGDEELTLFWRAVRDSADIYADLLQCLARGERFGEKQTEKGRLYQVKHRGWTHERNLARRINTGLLKDVHLDKRVHWFKIADK